MHTLIYEYPLHLLILAFLAATFIQSGIDKIIDWKGNKEWLTSHFAQSPFKGIVPLLLGVITLVETAAGFLCAAGIFLIIFGGSLTIGLIGIELAGLNLVMLLLGQRIAKDYAGAAGLVPYFLVAALGVYVFLEKMPN